MPERSKREPNTKTGGRGEDIAVAFLKGIRFRIIERNYRCRAGEIDIIARDAGTLVFVEVKARKNLSYGLPQLAVTPFKQRQISKAAVTWLVQKGLLEAPSRFDVVAILMRDCEVPEITHIKNAFEVSY